MIRQPTQHCQSCSERVEDLVAVKLMISESCLDAVTSEAKLCTVNRQLTQMVKHAVREWTALS